MRRAHSVLPLARESSPTRICALAADRKSCSLLSVRREGDRLTRRAEHATAAGETIPFLLSHLERSAWIVTWDLPAAAIHCKLWDAMERGDLECEWLVAAPTTSIIQCRRAGSATRMLTWIDLSNYTRGDYELVERLGSVEEGKSDSLQARARLYLRALMSLIRLCRSQSWGGLRYTVAGTAFAAYRRRYLPRHVACDGRTSSKLWCHDSIDALEIERGAYFSDEVLVNRRGRIEGPIWKVDVNSLYPWALADPYQPAGLAGVVDCPTLDAVASRAQYQCVVAQVRLAQAERTYPVRYDGRIAWASGSFTTALCGEELIDAISNGHVQSIDRAAYYRRADLFRPIIHDWYELRLTHRSDGNSALADWIKLLLVSLYGKFAQSATRWVEIGADDPGVVGWKEWGGWSSCSCSFASNAARRGGATSNGASGRPVGVNIDSVQHYRAIAGRVQRLERALAEPRPGVYIEEPSHDASISIAAYCTMRARRLMRDLRRQCGPRNWYYQGVDCLLVSRRGLQALESRCGRSLGLLKVSGPFPDAEIVGPKCYRLGPAWTVAGLTCRPHQRPDSGRITQRRRRSLADSLQSGKPVAIEEEELDLRAYSPRVLASVSAGGWTRPWHLVETREPGDDSPHPHLIRKRRPRSSHNVL